MKSVFKLLSLFLLIAVSLTTIVLTAMAQTATNQASGKASGSISGRVTISSEPVAGVEVMLKTSGDSFVTEIMNASPSLTATTDASGWYKLTGVAAGSYRVVAYAPAHVIEGGNDPRQPGKGVNLAEGEHLENLNFSMTHGGVITGRVTDQHNRAVIAGRVQTYKVNADGSRGASDSSNFFNMWQTDDRGVYRIYGLEPGRYIIGAGDSPDDSFLRIDGGGPDHRQTFHPEAIEESKAKIIEVRAGSEAENIDIKLTPASKSKTFAAAGRVIESESGKPVAGVMVGSFAARKDSEQESSVDFGFKNAATNSSGEFRLEGLKPGAYQAFVMNIQASENYGESLNFEISGSDVSGLEIKMRKGSSISGLAVIEGANDPKLNEKLTKVQISAISTGDDGDADVGISFSGAFGGAGQIAANGSFKIGGVKPGKVRLMANTFMAEKGLSLLRVELNGAEVKELQVSAGENLTGTRLVFAYGTASIAGRLEVRGGELPPTTKLAVLVRREGGGEDVMMEPTKGDVDTRGQFLIEGLSAGTYRLAVVNMGFGHGERLNLPDIEKTVVVSGNGKHDIGTVVLDLSKEKK